MDKHKGKWNDYEVYHSESVSMVSYPAVNNFKRLRCFPILNIWDKGSWETGGSLSREMQQQEVEFPGKVAFQCAPSLISPSLCVSHSSSGLVYDF